MVDRSTPPPTTPLETKRASAKRALASLAAALALLIAAAANPPATAHAAPETITGTCYLECLNPEIDGPTGGNVFIVRFPQYGIEETGYCISGPMYGTPMPGHYPFTGTRTADGGYDIAIDCSGAPMYPNHWSQLGAQNVGGLKIFLYGTVGVEKRSLEPHATDDDPAFSLEGAVYGVYRDEACADEAARIVTDAAGGGQVESELMIGSYWVREIEPPKGYVLDETVHRVDLAANDAREGTVPIARSGERPIRGDIEILKVGNAPGTAGDAGKVPLSGIAFDILRQPSGTLAARIVTDDEGRAATSPLREEGQSGFLPAGTYLVREDPETTPAGYRPLSPFAVVVEADGAILRYTLENETGTHVVVEKRDAESGEIVKLPMAFRVLDKDMQPIAFPLSPQDGAGGKGSPDAEAAKATFAQGGNPAVEHGSSNSEDARDGADAAPEGMTFDLATDDSGTCALPAPINGSGTFYIQETTAPEGYVVNPDPVPFEVGKVNADGDEGRAEDGVDRETEPANMLEAIRDAILGSEPIADPVDNDAADEMSHPLVVVVENDRTLGRLSIAKSCAETGEVLAGAVYELRAAENIELPDGTVAIERGEIAATLETDEKGTAVSEPIPLGSYELRETHAPEGYAVDEEEYAVELAYEDQETPVVEVKVDLTNRPLDNPIDATTSTSEPEASALAKTGDAPMLPIAASVAALAACSAVVAKSAMTRRNRRK